MTDVRIVQKGDKLAASSYEAVRLDLLLLPTGQLDTSGDLDTAVTIALFSDRRARDDDKLPDPKNDDRRGWWADLDAQAIWNATPIGSRLWLLGRASITDANARQGATVDLIEEYATEALQPFLDLKIATEVDVTATRNGLTSIDLVVTLYRGSTTLFALQYQDLWSQFA